MIRGFKGKTPSIAQSAFVSESAYLVGDVQIGDESSVWPGAVLRADFGPIKVGRNCQIEDNVVIHSGWGIELGDKVHIGHNAMVHASKVGQNVLIGSSATILHNVEIGDNCVIGAGALLTDGMKIPSGSLVLGVPATIAGPVTEKQMTGLARSLKVYADLAQEFKKEGLGH